jgi:hypothetical protein
MARILIVEDEPDIAIGLPQDLRLEGHDEAVNEDGIEFGSTKVGRVLDENAVGSANERRDTIFRELRAHTAGCQPSDEVTLIAGVVR